MSASDAQATLKGRMKDLLAKIPMPQGHAYHLIRVGLFVAATILIVIALFMLSFTTGQVSRTQEVAASQVQSEQRAEVLILASFDDSDAATVKQRDGLLDLLNRSSVGADVEYLDVAGLDTSRNRGDSARAYGNALAQSSWGQALARKIADHGDYSAVVCLDDEALCYMESVHESLFAKTPVVFMGVSDADHAQAVFNAGYATGLVEGLDAAGMLKTAASMQTDASRVVVLTDNTATGLGDRAQFENAVADAAEKGSKAAQMQIDFVNASAMTRSELAKRISSAGDDAIIIYLDANTDSAGNAYAASQSAYYVSNAASVPVFAVGFDGVGEGFAGSGFVDHERQGQRAGEMIVMVLNGTRPADIPIETFTSEGSVFDTEVLGAYGLSTSLLPASASTLHQTGLNTDVLRPIVLPIILLVLGALCLALFALFGYRRTATDMAEIVTQRNLLEQRFYTDHLTEMPNMQWLTAYAASDASSKVRSIIEVALLGLEHVEATRGKGSSDEVIKALAERLNGLDNLFLVRPGQSEFIIGVSRELKPGSPSLDKIEYVLNQPIEVAGDTITVDPCIGVYNRELGMSIEEMVAGVDIAVHQAQQLGLTGEVIFYDADMRRAVEHKLEITTLLKKAIEGEDLAVVYQPQIDLVTNDVLGYEALVRLRHREFEPEQFIPISELNGQIVDIDRIVTKKVVQQLATWKKRKQRMRPVSINHSAGQLRDEGYIKYLSDLLDEYGVAHNLVRLDIRESLFINNMAKASEFVEELREAGFGLAIDGFGAGYTSIGSVMQIPAEVVKIDRSLTASFLAGGDSEVIENLVRLVHGANKVVVIEGVETLEQLQRCREMDCDVVQGFFFSEPLLPEQAVRYKPIEMPAMPAPAKRKAKAAAAVEAVEVEPVAETNADAGKTAAESAGAEAAAEAARADAETEIAVKTVAAEVETEAVLEAEVEGEEVIEATAAGADVEAEATDAAEEVEAIIEDDSAEIAEDIIEVSAADDPADGSVNDVDDPADKTSDSTD